MNFQTTLLIFSQFVASLACTHSHWSLLNTLLFTTSLRWFVTWVDFHTSLLVFLAQLEHFLIGACAVMFSSNLHTDLFASAIILLVTWVHFFTSLVVFRQLVTLFTH